MNFNTACLSVFWLFFLLHHFYCLKVIPERAEVAYFNQSYVEGTPILNVRRSSRKGEYVSNLFFTSTKELGNNIMVDVNFYQYLHNEFKRSFPELHFHLCDLINDDPYIGKAVRKAGLTECPIQPGTYHVANISFHQDIPSVWPFEKGMVEFILNISPKILLAKAIVVVTFKEDNVQKTKI